MTNQNVVEFSDANFEAEVLQSDIPVLVDFWAEWCGPCKMLMPTISEVADEWAGKVKVGKVDTEQNREAPMKFGISAIPTVILFKNGEEVKKFVGIQSKEQYNDAIREAVGPEAAAQP